MWDRGPQRTSGFPDLVCIHRLSPLCGFNSYKLRTCPNMTMAVERNIKFLLIWGFMSLSSLYRSYCDK